MNTTTNPAARIASELSSRLRARLATRSRGQHGLALLDLLLGMAIFSIMAIIAVSVLGNMRERAYVEQAAQEGKTVAQVKEEAGVVPSEGDSAPQPTVNDATPPQPSGVPWTPIFLGLGALVAFGGAGTGVVIMRRAQADSDELTDEPLSV